MTLELTSDAIAYLENSPILRYGEVWDGSKTDLDRLGVSPDTAFYQLYIMPGILPLGRYRSIELSTLDRIIWDLEGGTALFGMEEEDRTPERLNRFLAITSFEGGGGWHYDIKTDAVYDCDWGMEYGMLDGTMPPTFKTSCDFFNWLYGPSPDEEE